MDDVSEIAWEYRYTQSGKGDSSAVSDPSIVGRNTKRLNATHQAASTTLPRVSPRGAGAEGYTPFD